MKRAALRLGLAALAAGGLAWLVVTGFYAGWWRFNYPDRERFPLWGVDVSHHQGAIDWPTVARQPNLVFAYLKATEGGDWTDPRFLDNWYAARRAGLIVGGYHFFTFCRPPLEQASHFLAVLPRDPDTLPPAVDVEYGGNCATTANEASIRADLATFVERVESELSRKLVLYVTPEAHAQLFDSRELERLWLRDIYREPRSAQWSFWQFANRGRVPGIATLVDLDVSRHVDRALLVGDAP